MVRSEIPDTPPIKDHLGNGAPRWFESWHNLHFTPVCRRSRRNEKLIYIILATILAAAALGNGNINLIGRLLGAFIDAQGG